MAVLPVWALTAHRVASSSELCFNVFVHFRQGGVKPGGLEWSTVGETSCAPAGATDQVFRCTWAAVEPHALDHGLLGQAVRRLSAHPAMPGCRGKGDPRTGGSTTEVGVQLAHGAQLSVDEPFHGRRWEGVVCEHLEQRPCWAHHSPS